MDQEWGTFLQYKALGGVLCDDVGLGKTGTMIALMCSEPRSTEAGANLVITPSHLFKQWRTEIDKFAGDSVTVIEGYSAFEKRHKDIKAGTAELLDNRTIVLVDIYEVMERTPKVHYDWRKIYEPVTMKRIRAAPEVIAKFRKAAISISGGYTVTVLYRQLIGANMCSRGCFMTP